MSLADNVKGLRKLRGLSTHQLAAESGIPQSSVSRIENNGTWPRRTTLAALARALGVDVEYLISERKQIQIQVLVERRWVPIIDYVQAGHWREVSSRVTEESHTDYILADLVDSADTFALRIKGESMLPEFREGDIITVDPAISPRPGDYVVAADKSGEAVFKQFAYVRVSEGGDDVFELRSLNPLFPNWSSDVKPFRVVGTMVEVTRRYRRSK